MTITAAADGSALGNPGPNGWAWYIDDDNWAAGGSPHGTNNQGELQAVLELLRATAGTDEKLLIRCDSRYVIDSVTKWMPGWKRKGWRKGDGKPVMNVDIIQAIDVAMKGRRVQFEWVKGHAGHPLNEEADKRAVAASTAFQARRPHDPGPGYPGAAASAPVEAVAPEEDLLSYAEPAPVASSGDGDQGGVLHEVVELELEDRPARILEPRLRSGDQRCLRVGARLHDQFVAVAAEDRRESGRRRVLTDVAVEDLCRKLHFRWRSRRRCRGESVH